MGGKHKEREKRRSRDRSRDKEREKGRDKQKRSRDRDRERDRAGGERERQHSSRSREERDREREGRKSSRRSRSRDRKNRDGEQRRRRTRSRSPSHHSQVQQTFAPPSPPPAAQHAAVDNVSAAASFLAQRNNFMNLFGGATDLALMEQELALNPHLLQRMTTLATESDLGAQLLKFNNELAGLGCAGGGITTTKTTNQAQHLGLQMTPMAMAQAAAAAAASQMMLMQANPAASSSYDAMSNSCDNSQDGQNSNSGLTAAEERRRKKKSRWGGSDNEKTFIPGMPTVLPSTLSADQQEAYLVQLQIEEISRKLRTGEQLAMNINEKERSPSPEPIYSSDGKRLNTREFRTKKKLEEQRHQLVVRMQCMNPEFKPPTDYKPPVIRVSDKVLIPQEEHPDINFVGLLIGPRGNTLKAMEKDTGAKIIIRGKGSVKEGKVGRKDGQPLPGEDEPLHAFITASTAESVKKAVDKIKEVITQGIEVPEGHNDLRRMQLRELAQLNGTLRETDAPRCNNCGSSEHKSWLCPDKPNVTNNILCSICGGAGHIAKDCRSKKTGVVSSPNKIDEEYMSLMAELGEGPPPAETNSGNTNNHKSNNSRFGLFEQRQAPRSLMGGGGSHYNNNNNSNSNSNNNGNRDNHYQHNNNNSNNNYHHHQHNNHYQQSNHQHHQQSHQSSSSHQLPPPPWNQSDVHSPPPIPPPPVGHQQQPPLPNSMVAAPVPAVGAASTGAVAPPPMMPWMQPPPPGMEPPQWPGVVPPPPPVVSVTTQQSMIPAQFQSWMAMQQSFATPPLPPGIDETALLSAGLLAPPPPPPPPV